MNARLDPIVGPGESAAVSRASDGRAGEGAGQGVRLGARRWRRSNAGRTREPHRSRHALPESHVVKRSNVYSGHRPLRSNMAETLTPSAPGLRPRIAADWLPALTTWLKGIDLRRVGSGNVGAANVYRTAGLAVALIVVRDRRREGRELGDAGRAADCRDRRRRSPPVWRRSRSHLSGVAALSRRQGRGDRVRRVLVLAPVATAMAAVVFVITVWITRYVSLGSVVATAALPPLAWITDAPLPVVAGGVDRRAADHPAPRGQSRACRGGHRAPARAEGRDHSDRRGHRRGQLGHGARSSPGAHRSRRAAVGARSGAGRRHGRRAARTPSICRTSTFPIGCTRWRSLGDALDGARIVVLAVPSHGLRAVLRRRRRMSCRATRWS